MNQQIKEKPRIWGGDEANDDPLVVSSVKPKMARKGKQKKQRNKNEEVAGSPQYEMNNSSPIFHVQMERE